MHLCSRDPIFHTKTLSSLSLISSIFPFLPLPPSLITYKKKRFELINEKAYVSSTDSFDPRASKLPSSSLTSYVNPALSYLLELLLRCESIIYVYLNNIIYVLHEGQPKDLKIEKAYHCLQ